MVPRLSHTGSVLSDRCRLLQAQVETRRRLPVRNRHIEKIATVDQEQLRDSMKKPTVSPTTGRSSPQAGSSWSRRRSQPEPASNNILTRCISSF